MSFVQGGETAAAQDVPIKTSGDFFFETSISSKGMETLIELDVPVARV